MAMAESSQSSPVSFTRKRAAPMPQVVQKSDITWWPSASTAADLCLRPWWMR